MSKQLHLRTFVLNTWVLALLFCCLLQAQPNTEVYLTPMQFDGGSLLLGKLNNISTNPGYDNQPSFFDDHSMYFASTRNGQTDILQYSLRNRSKTWHTNTPNGSEYSPLKVPAKDAVSAIRLDKDGTQLLYEYGLPAKGYRVLVPELKVGYHLWYSPFLLIATVLVEDRMDLKTVYLKDSIQNTLFEDVGRSLHRIPKTNLVSFISKKEGKSILMSLDPFTGLTETLTDLPEGTEDVCWLKDTTVICAQGNKVFRQNPFTDAQWKEVAEIKKPLNITRLAVNPSNSQLALVGVITPELLIDKQVATYNAGDLTGFADCFSKTVTVKNFPNRVLYTGRQTLYDGYTDFAAQHNELSVKVLNRIALGNIVIDEEEALVDGEKYHQAAIYEIANDKIASMNFIHNRKANGNEEAIVQKQLDAYNARDIDAFAATYSDDITLRRYPNTIQSEGLETLRESYGSFFANTPDLKAEIKNRIVVGNKVIDEELVTVNGNQFSTIAIYEVKDDKIVRVTFIR